MECLDGSKFVSYSLFLLASQGAYSTPSKTEAELILRELAQTEFRAEPWLSALHNVDTQYKAAEDVSNSAILKQKLKQNLSNTCSMRKRVARDFDAVSGIPSASFPRNRKIVEETKARELEVDAVKTKLSKTRETENVVDIS